VTETVLLLDVDGVINVRPQVGGWNPPPVRANVAGIPIYYERELPGRLRAMGDLLTVHWSTTWCGLPTQLEALNRLLGVDFRPAFGDRPLSKAWGDLKVEAALQVLAGGNLLVWVDDEEAEAGRRLFPAIARAEREARALLITPSSAYGVQPDDLDAIEWFAGRGRLAA